MHNLQELKIWQKSIAISKLIYVLMDQMVVEEKYGLISQIKRSVISISSNIAEGAGRNSKKEFIHFLSVAQGSSYELYTQLYLCIELELLPKEKLTDILREVIEIQKMNYAFQNFLKSQI